MKNSGASAIQSFIKRCKKFLTKVGKLLRSRKQPIPSEKTEPDNDANNWYLKALHTFKDDEEALSLDENIIEEMERDWLADLSSPASSSSGELDYWLMEILDLYCCDCSGGSEPQPEPECEFGRGSIEEYDSDLCLQILFGFEDGTSSCKDDKSIERNELETSNYNHFPIEISNSNEIIADQRKCSHWDDSTGLWRKMTNREGLKEESPQHNFMVSDQSERLVSKFECKKTLIF